MSEAATTKRYKLTIAYDGTLFHGWQKQDHQPGSAAQPGEEPLRTVQQVVEKAVAQVTAQRVKVVGASRTDAGVHARGQVAHVDLITPIPTERLPHAINSRLPDDVEVLSAEEADLAFDAISDAKRKQYRYRLFNSSRRPLNKRHSVWHCWLSLDIERMNDAARRLIGTHDVAGLANADHGRENTVRTIFNCFAERVPDPLATPEPPGSYLRGAGGEVHIVVEGSGFLYNMVRIIAGTLVEVGRGRFEPEVIDRILATADRSLAGPTLPPQGLCLEWIRYDG